MHYESLRLRIVEIEHDISKNERAKAVAFKGTGHVDHHLQHKPSTGQLGRRSPPPPAQGYDDDTDSDDEDDIAFDDEAEEALSLERFPSGSARLQQQQPSQQLDPELPELEPDEEGYSDDEEPQSPDEPTEEELSQSINQGQTDNLYATAYEGVRKCVCHGKTNAPIFDRIWDLPPDQSPNARPGVTRAVAQISNESPVENFSTCTTAHAPFPAQETIRA